MRLALAFLVLLGLLVDLASPLMHGRDQVGPLLGPHALGYVFGCYMILQLRAMLFRRRAVTFAVMTAMAMIAAGLVVVFLLAVALLLGPILVWTVPIWRFRGGLQQHAGRR